MPADLPIDIVSSNKNMLENGESSSERSANGCGGLDDEYNIRQVLSDDECGMSEADEARLRKMCGAVRTLLECVGEDAEREGLLSTPSRVAKALLFFTQGYHRSVESVVHNALFHESQGGMVIMKGIETASLCEHHLLPFHGKVFLPASASLLCS